MQYLSVCFMLVCTVNKRVTHMHVSVQQTYTQLIRLLSRLRRGHRNISVSVVR